MFDRVSAFDVDRYPYQEPARERRIRLMEPCWEEFFPDIVQIRHRQAKLVQLELARGPVSHPRHTWRGLPYDRHTYKSAFEAPAHELECVQGIYWQCVNDGSRTVPRRVRSQRVRPCSSASHYSSAEHVESERKPGCRSRRHNSEPEVNL